MTTHNIDSFMTWFLNEVIRIFTYTYTTMDSIQFGGTSLLRVVLGVLILGGALPVLLTIARSLAQPSVTASERVREAKEEIRYDNWLYRHRGE